MLPDRIKPCIVVYVYTHPGCEQKIREVQAGMEEEGIPCSIVRSSEQDASSLAYQAACASKLGVGVGIGEHGLSIQHEKLPEKEPLFTVTVPGTPTDWRHFGYNAARLVKGIPFKNQSVEEIDPQCQDSSALYHLVWSIVQKILQETGQGYGEVKTWSKTH
jgi:hypothetical protein